MRMPYWWSLAPSEQEIYQAAFRFLGERLEELETMQWALSLKPTEKAKQLAIIDLAGDRRRKDLSLPWLKAWQLIIDNWNRPVIERDSTEVYAVGERLKSREYTKRVASKIVDLVTPRLKIALVNPPHQGTRKRGKKIKSWEDLIFCTLTSGPILDIKKLELEKIDDKEFLFSLATALDNLIVSSLDLAQRIGWDGERKYWVIGQMHRVYYVQKKDGNWHDDEPDRFADGIVPAVKILYEVLARFADVDSDRAASFIKRWNPDDSQIHLRLLAALYRDSRLTSTENLNDLFLQLNETQFWELRTYPEVAELRAKRFNDLNAGTKHKILKRIKKSPPSSHYHRTMDKEQIKKARRYCAVREMKRIQLAGGELSEESTAWLKGHIPEFPELQEMKRVDEGFPEGVQVRRVESKPDLRFNTLEGEERLQALESDMRQKRSWFDEHEGNARNWIQDPQNCLKLISDFESADDGGSKFAKVWEKFGWAHVPVDKNENKDNRDNLSEFSRVLSLLEQIKIETISFAINGISHWLDRWRSFLLSNPKGIKVWLRIWPIASEATNSEEVENETAIDITGRLDNGADPRELNTLNTPAGKLISAFLAACPDLTKEVKPFASGQPLRKIRDTIFSSEEHSLLIAQHRCLEIIDYFLFADREWAIAHLITPLKAQDASAAVLWRAISRRIRRKEALKIIGDEMIARANDNQLGRDSRSMLVSNLVIDSLHSYWRETEPAVQRSKVQQMLRSVEDEVRVSGAEILQRFLKEFSAPDQDDETPALIRPEELYSKAVKPFLVDVWPQEKSLATPGVSRALADLPASTCDCFADAVQHIGRFLVPFDCWSLGDYGFYRAGRDDLALELIDSEEKAEAFLHLLDRTIGSQERAIVPYELTHALERIRKIHPRISGQQAFRRLETAARR